LLWRERRDRGLFIKPPLPHAPPALSREQFRGSRRRLDGGYHCTVARHTRVAVDGYHPRKASTVLDRRYRLMLHTTGSNRLMSLNLSKSRSKEATGR
jgi:hypothetical protein